MPTPNARRLGRARRKAVDAFHQGACVRTPNKVRLAEGYSSYKKGWEIRFSIASEPEASKLQRILQDAGLSGGTPYRKSKNRWILPLYGREQVTLFLEWVEGTTRR